MQMAQVTWRGKVLELGSLACLAEEGEVMADTVARALLEARAEVIMDPQHDRRTSGAGEALSQVHSFTSGELAVRGEDEGWTWLAVSESIGFEPPEVRHVLRDECPFHSDGGYEHLVVRRTLEAPVVGIMKRNDIVAACSELLGHGGGVHLVNEKRQPRSWRSRSSVCSCRSPSSSTMVMKRSTSSGYSA